MTQKTDVTGNSGANFCYPPDLLPCPLCGGRGQYVDDGEADQRVDCTGEGTTAEHGCGVGVWMQTSMITAGEKWNSIPRRVPTAKEIAERFGIKVTEHDPLQGLIGG